MPRRSSGPWTRRSPASRRTRTPPRPAGRPRSSRPMPGDPPAVARVDNRAVPGPEAEIPVRIYWPAGANGSSASPGVVFFHGGGWVICDLDSHDAQCRGPRQRASTRSSSRSTTGSRPSTSSRPRPTTATRRPRWVADHAAELGIDPTRLAVAGDSAGGNLTAAVALMARDRGGPPLVYQALIYPVIDSSATRNDYPSKIENAIGYFLTTDSMEWYRRQYLRDDADGDDPYCSPILASSLAGLPPAFVVTAEYDPLRDEGEEYAKQLDAAGVPTGQYRAPRDVPRLLRAWTRSSTARSTPRRSRSTRCATARAPDGDAGGWPGYDLDRSRGASSSTACSCRSRPSRRRSSRTGRPTPAPTSCARWSSRPTTHGFFYVAVCDHLAVTKPIDEHMQTTWYDTVATLGWIAALTTNVRDHVPRVRAVVPPPAAHRQVVHDARRAVGRTGDPRRRRRPPPGRVRAARPRLRGARQGHRRRDRRRPRRVRRRVPRPSRPRIGATSTTPGWRRAPARTRSRSGSAARRSRRCGAPPSAATAGCPRARRAPRCPAQIAFLLEHRKQTLGDEPIDLGTITEFLYVGDPGWDVGEQTLTGKPDAPRRDAQRVRRRWA